MIPTMACLICNRLVATGGVCPSCASPEDEEFNRIEMESRIKQEYVRAMRKTTREEKIARPAVYEVPTEDYSKMFYELTIARALVREFGDRLAKLEKPWVGLTDEELEQLSNKWRIIYGGHVDDFSREVEAKLKEKNNG